MHHLLLVVEIVGVVGSGIITRALIDALPERYFSPNVYDRCGCRGIRSFVITECWCRKASRQSHH